MIEVGVHGAGDSAFARAGRIRGADGRARGGQPVIAMVAGSAAATSCTCAATDSRPTTRCGHRGKVG